MDDVIEIISEVAEPVVETLKEWGENAIDTIKDQAPHYLRFVGYALRNIHL
jgi:hypothetical protein